ncbi:MAG: exopolysaccharide biosynthesis polyprenyl glycosylphosphotransferase [Frankiales bacterium]|nr:exopolysaccharide biosynthesis polyprenyl glycosylphosphotransferase [Frankiales bacterium]
MSAHTHDTGPALRAVPLAPRPLKRPTWERKYALSLAVVDLLLICSSALLAYEVRLGGSNDATLVAGGRTLPYGLVVGALAPLWLLMLAASRSYEARFLGVGFEEFKRVGNASVRLVALIGFLAFASKASIARGFVAVAIPLGLMLLLLGRYAARRVLHSLRSHGVCVHHVVAVGSVAEVLALAEQVDREPFAGLRVVAVALPDYDKKSELRYQDRTLPNVGPARDMANKLPEMGIDTVAVAGASALSSRELRQLSWDLEGTGTDLVVAPAITDVTGPRIHVRPVAGLPLLHLEAPAFGGARRVFKRLIDLSGALTLLLALAVPLVVLAVAIKVEDRGRVFFKQERVGRASSRFNIWKFRSMREGAHDEIAELLALNESDGPLFKLRQDPRVTRVGNVLRKYSLDELPQLFNVIGGSMSLVGPRPPLPTEVDVYDDHVHRRLLVKPGMTGLWQVSGRADLPWEESVRLDLYYVENWSVALDIQILWKTLFAVARSSGAY